MDQNPIAFEHSFLFSWLGLLGIKKLVASPIFNFAVQNDLVCIYLHHIWPTCIHTLALSIPYSWKVHYTLFIFLEYLCQGYPHISKKARRERFKFYIYKNYNKEVMWHVFGQIITFFFLSKKYFENFMIDSHSMDWMTFDLCQARK